MRSLYPAGQHSTEAFLLRQIEVDIRAMARGKDDGDPEPIWLAGEEEAHEEMVTREERNAESIADAFGLRL